MTVLRRVLVAGLAATLAGCGSAFTADPLEPGELGHEIATLGVLPINWQDSYEMRVFDNPVGLLGTAGKVVVEKGRETRRRKFTQAVEDSRYDYREDFTLALAAALSEHGLETESMAYRRKPHPQAGRVLDGRFEDAENYPVGRTDYPAFLDIYVDYVGMASENITSDFFPAFHVGVRVVNGENGDILYQQQIQYTSFADEEEAVIRLGPNPDYQFTDYDDIMANLERARDGMREAVHEVASRIANDLGEARDQRRANR